MSLNHDVQTPPREENYLNGNIQDFTDCIDFTKQYQKSCSYNNDDFEQMYSSPSPVPFQDSFHPQKSYNSEQSDNNIVINNENSDDKNPKDPPQEENPIVPPNKPELENGKHLIEPDVSITIPETNLEKTINHVAKGSNDLSTVNKNINGEAEHVPSVVKRKRVVNRKKNHIKVPNRNIKKKVGVLKFKNGRYTQKKKESQYQNILSNIKFRCYKCSNSEFGSLSELVVHQRKCLNGPQENPLLPQEPSPFAQPPTNSKTPRKVYLCSACGNYYENWNLFLHMIEMHKRHICLYCLGMFSHPDKLAQHLHTKHNVIEQNLSSSEDFLKLYKGTCYFICCTCETMFSEQDEFNEHSCTGEGLNIDVSACPLCGLQGAHFPTCRRAFTDRYVDSGGYKSHPALGKKLTKKKVKKQKEVFRIENNGEMSMTVTVRKQQVEPESSIDNNNESDIVSPSRTSTEQYNEKMLQLYRANKPIEKVEKVEKVTSTLQSIEESINRVVESSKIEEEEEEEEDTNLGIDDKPDESINLSMNVGDPPVEEKKPDEISSRMDEVNDKITNGDINNDSDNDSTDSEKLTIAFDQPVEKEEEEDEEPEMNCDKNEETIPTAGSDIPFINVTIKDDSSDVKALIREFVKESCWNCVYCAHAKRIAVNGKQLSLHLIAEHRYSSVPAESTDEEKIESSKKIVEMLKNNLNNLENCYFNTDTFDSTDKSFWKANDRIYECFHCLFATYVHKELYSHNKKMHQKNVFLCIMCKSNFYNYSELLCHLCPGQYIPGVVINPDITYRCFLCNVDPLPSSFRLMVHLRRRHNSCDICFDASANQSQLSTHVWKHKLSHYCYLCGIAYRNKPDITKHLFWKHGTESVLCKKCLQKKWPHVYHFCIPPNSFTCDECSSSLKSAVALKVHKRLHSGEYPYSCNQCEEKFISKKLLDKHLIKHEEEKNPPPPPTPPPVVEPPPEVENHVEEAKENEVINEDVEKKPEKEKKKKKKPLTDVFDLPPVNLSESDDSDEDEDVNTPKLDIPPPQQIPEPPIQNGYLNGDVEKEEPEIVDGVWNNFQNYLVSKEPGSALRTASPFKNMSLSRIKAIMLSDHDYHIIPCSSSTELNSSKSDAEKSAEDKEKIGLDHDYCNNVGKGKSKNKQKRHREGSKSSSSSDSSDSDSSCSCGSNCSCSSGSSSSSSSNESDSDEREKRRKEKKKVAKEEKVENEVEPEAEADPEPQTEVDISVNDIEPPLENPIRDSDLETDETETDEDFYDDNPAREANRILAEKRFQLVANLNGSDVPVSSPSTPTEKPPVQKKKTKMKKRRSQPRPRASTGGPKVIRRKQPAAAPPPPIVNNVLPSYQYNGSSTPIPNYETPVQPFARLQEEENVQSSGDSDSKRPKRKRVPLKFYGFSSDDEAETTPAPKKREKIEHNTTTPAPSATSTPTVKSSREEIPTIWNPHSKNSLSWRVEKSETPPTPKVNPIKIRTSQTMRNNTVHYTSATTNSEVFHIKRPERSFQINGNSGITGQKGEKLYCFCQCPYDEVSEMIACDAKDCVIEWFHFECVGIMVPPQGSWYCPDCRKKLAAENEFMPPPISEQNLN